MLLAWKVTLPLQSPVINPSLFDDSGADLTSRTGYAVPHRGPAALVGMILDFRPGVPLLAMRRFDSISLGPRTAAK